MTFSASDKAKLKEAFGMYCEITANKYKFVKDLDIEFSEDFEKKMENLIKRERKPYYYIINTTAKKVACIIVAIIVMVASTVLSVDALREGVKNFFVEVYERFSSIAFERETDSPSSIVTFFEPSYIPDGFKREIIQKDNYGYSIKYTNDKKQKISYIQSYIGSDANINTECGITEEIQGGLYVHNTKTKSRMFLKSDGEYEYYISVSDSISKEELLKIAESVKPEG